MSIHIYQNMEDRWREIIDNSTASPPPCTPITSMIQHMVKESAYIMQWQDRVDDWYF